MKKNKKRFLLIIVAVLIVVFAASAFLLAANDLTVRYLNADNSIFETDYASLQSYQIGESGNYQYQLNVTTPGETPEKEGYTFSYWTTNWPTAPDSYGPNQSINLAYITAAYGYTYQALMEAGVIYSNEIVFTPHFTANTYDVTLTNSLTGSGDYAVFEDQTFGQVVNSPAGLPVPTEAGYTFIGWKDIGTGLIYSLNADDKILYTLNTADDVILDAVWVVDDEYDKVVEFKDADTGVLYDYFFGDMDDSDTAPTLPAGAKEGHTFNQWLNEDEVQTLAAGETFDFATAAAVYYADWTVNEYSISVNATDSAIGGIHVGSVEYAYGSAVTFTATPSSANNIMDTVSVTMGVVAIPVTDNGDGSYTFTMPAGNVLITATAKQNIYSIGTDAVNASITVNPTAAIGEYVTFTAAGNPSATYNLTSVYVTVNGTSVYVPVTFISSTGTVSTYGFTMPEGNVTVHATGSAEVCTLIVLAWDNTLLGIEPVTNGSTYDIDANYTPELRNGYSFDGWYSTGSGAEFTGTTMISGNTIVKAIYIPDAQTISKAPDCSANVSALNVFSVNRTGDATSGNLLAATNNTCVSSTGAPTQFTVKSAPNYLISGVAVRPAGEESMTAIELNLVSYDEALDEYTYSFTMPAEDVEIAVYTKAIPYTVNVNELALPEGGTYTINGYYTDNHEVAQGSTVTVPVTLAPGYKISALSIYYDVEGAGRTYLQDAGHNVLDSVLNPSVLLGTVFAFTMPQADVTVNITYEKIDYEIDTLTSNGATTAPVNQGKVTATANGVSSTDLADITATIGDTVSLTVAPQYGYSLKTLTVKDSANKTLNINTLDVSHYEFTMPASDVVVTATFVKDQYTVIFRDYNNVMLDQQIVNYRENPVMPAAPSRVGFDFAGWASADTETVVPTSAPSTTAADFVIVKATVITAVYTPHVFSITYNTPANGTIDPKEATEAYQSEATFTVTPDEGYQIDKVTATYNNAYGVKTTITFNATPDDLKVGGEYAFTMPDGDVSVVVSFKEIEYNVVLTSIVGDGTIYLNGYDRDNMTAAYGASVSIFAIPDAGWDLVSITVTGAGSGDDIALDRAIAAIGGGYKFIMPAEGVNIEVEFTQHVYNITYSVGANGSVSNNDLTMAYQSTASFTATPDAGYQIDSVTGTYYGTDGTLQSVTFESVPADLTVGGVYTFIMPASIVNIQVSFKEIAYDVTLDLTGEAAIKLSDVDQTSMSADYKEVVTVAITPEAGWELQSVAVAGATTTPAVTPAIDPAGGTYSFTMPAEDVTVSVVLIQSTFNITYNDPDNGVIDPKETSKAYQSSAAFTATPDEGYQIASAEAYYYDAKGIKQTVAFDVEPDDLTVGGEYAFTMPAADVHVKVLFEEETYNVDLTTIGDATVLLNDVDQIKDEAIYGSSVTLNITPDKGWELKSITVTGEAPEEYPGEAGLHDADSTIEVTPAINAAGGTYTFVMPASDVDVTVTLARISSGLASYAISFTGAEHGTISVTPKTTAQYEQVVTVVADPDDGYRFKAISVKTADGSYISPAFVSEDAEYVTTYSFEMPACAVEIYVTFEEYAATRYTDCRTDDWYYTATEFVSERGYFKGISSTLFGPNLKMDRAMFVTVLGRIAGIDTSIYTTSTFSDVNISTWYGPYVEWAAQEGIVLGYGNNVFGPTDSVTREQMAEIMYKYAQWAGYSITVDNPEWMDRYSDTAKISGWAEEAVIWSVSTGLIKGMSPTTIDPLGNATRAQVAQIIQNFCDKIIYQ